MAICCFLERLSGSIVEREVAWIYLFDFRIFSPMEMIESARDAFSGISCFVANASDANDGVPTGRVIPT